VQQFGVLKFGVGGLDGNLKSPTLNSRRPNYCTQSPPTWSCL